ncbi:MAG TPA: tRNA (adenosine(37)-N6)-dimethylallyltransferase MiaA [Candidatus Magasanikbacteria bacterium]|nr:tRNA (adenosine(37)-N6)-dimethylallyltransferase MiaA [Candidatus Magasanikbacteria bacterium]
MKNKLPKLVVICGPTASGKTDLAIDLAKKFNGEIINADSRQIYKEMSIATAKPLRVESQKLKAESFNEYVVDGINHYLLDIIKPDESFTLSDYKEQAFKAIKEIIKKDKTPFLVGGTGLYIKAIVDNLDIPKVEPNLALRRELENKTPEERLLLLKENDPETYEKIDLQNPRRVIRALEVVLSTGESFLSQQKKGKSLFNALQLGIKIDRESLYDRINSRCERMIETGLVQEAKKLAQKYSWDLPSMSGIGYRQMRDYIEGKMSLDEALDWLKQDTRHYAKRQMTWFKKDENIHWVENEKQAEKILTEFLK